MSATDLETIEQLHDELLGDETANGDWRTRDAFVEKVTALVAAAHASGYEAARGEQMERDCAAVCVYCAHIGQDYDGEKVEAPVHAENGYWSHPVSNSEDNYSEFCWSGAIRDAAIAALPLPPAGAGGGVDAGPKNAV